jgi:F0F1-type ATP synthase membrane subunit a
VWVRLHLSVERPRGVQNVLEYVFDFINGFVADNLGSERTRAIGPLAVALFLFILISNYLDLLPPWFKSPTSDLNTTAGLALMVFILVQVLGMRARGPGGYVKHFFQPFAALAPLEVIMELTKPVTLAFRLLARRGVRSHLRRGAGLVRWGDPGVHFYRAHGGVHRHRHELRGSALRRRAGG